MVSSSDLLELSSSKLRGLEQVQLLDEISQAKRLQRDAIIAKKAARRIPIVVELLHDFRSEQTSCSRNHHTSQVQSGEAIPPRLQGQLEALRAELRELDEERREDEHRIRTTEREMAAAVVSVRSQQLQREEELRRQLEAELVITAALEALVKQQFEEIERLSFARRQRISYANPD